MQVFGFWGLGCRCLRFWGLGLVMRNKAKGPLVMLRTPALAFLLILALRLHLQVLTALLPPVVDADTGTLVTSA